MLKLDTTLAATLKLDTTLLNMLKLDTTLLAMLKLDTTLAATLKLDTTLLAMLKWATLLNVPLLAEDQHREGGIQAGEGGSPRRGASGKHLWAALLSDMLLEVDTVLMASLDAITLLGSSLSANLPDRWRVGRSMLGWSSISTTPTGSADTRLPRSPSTWNSLMR